jgi:hypothetical protein
MEQVQRSGPCSMLFTIFTWGGLWGIFEATVGYLLHLLPFSIGWLIWYPVACFFMFQVYRKTQRTEAIVLVGLLSASIKLLNLFLPGRIDRVLYYSQSGLSVHAQGYLRLGPVIHIILLLIPARWKERARGMRTYPPGTARG